MGSGLIFGIARPVGEALNDLQHGDLVVYDKEQRPGGEWWWWAVAPPG